MKTTDSDIDALLGVNLRGTMLMCHAALPLMLRQPSGGSIVNIGSVVGSAGRAGVAAYAASKAGIVGA